MWGDYHARELAVMLLREARCEAYPTFFAASAGQAERIYKARGRRRSES